MLTVQQDGVYTPNCAILQHSFEHFSPVSNNYFPSSNLGPRLHVQKTSPDIVVS